MMGNGKRLPAGAPRIARRLRPGAIRKPGMRWRRGEPMCRNRGTAPPRSSGMAHPAASSPRIGRTDAVGGERGRKGRSPPPGGPARRSDCRTTPTPLRRPGNAWPFPASAIGRRGRTSPHSAGKRRPPRRSPGRTQGRGRFRVEWDGSALHSSLHPADGRARMGAQAFKGMKNIFGAGPHAKGAALPQKPLREQASWCFPYRSGAGGSRPLPPVA